MLRQADAKEGEFEEYVDYGAILTGEKEADDDEDDADFAPPRWDETDCTIIFKKLMRLLLLSLISVFVCVWGDREQGRTGGPGYS